jgi:MFS family permease
VSGAARPDGPASPGPSPATRLAGLLTLALVVGTVNGLSRVALPLYAASLGAQAWQVGLTGGLGYFGVMLLSLPIGAWIDRHGSRALFTGGVLAAAALMLVMPWLNQPWLAVAGTAVLGLVLPFRTVPAQTEFLMLLPQLSPSKAGWNRAAHTMGLFFLGPAASAAVIAGLGFTSVFELASAGLLVGFLVGRRALTGRTPTPSAAPHESLWQRVLAQFAMVSRHAEMRRTMLIDCLTQMAVAYFVVFALVLAVRRFGMPLQAAAGLVTLQGALFVATLFLGGRWLSQRTQEWQYLLAFGLLLAQALLFGLGTGPAALWLGAALMGLGVGLQGLTSTSRFAQLMQEHGRGRVGGLTSVAPTAGGMVGAIGGGLLSQQFGIEAGFRVLALLFGVLCVLQVLRLWRQSRTP